MSGTDMVCAGAKNEGIRSMTRENEVNSLGCVPGLRVQWKAGC